MKGVTLSLFCILTVLALVMTASVQRTDTGPPGKVETVMHVATPQTDVLQAVEASHFTCHQAAFEMRSGTEYRYDALQAVLTRKTERERNLELFKANTSEWTPYLYRRAGNSGENTQIKIPPLQLRT